jgi:hypothetical protein
LQIEVVAQGLMRVGQTSKSALVVTIAIFSFDDLPFEHERGYTSAVLKITRRSSRMRMRLNYKFPVNPAILGHG